MADSYHLTADALVAPLAAAAVASGSSAVDTPIDETITLTLKSSLTVELTSDSAVTITLPGPSTANASPQANVLIAKVVGQRVKATITTADGAAQVIPVDPLLILHTTGVSPITALTLTRTPGSDTFVHLFLGQI